MRGLFDNVHVIDIDVHVVHLDVVDLDVHIHVVDRPAAADFGNAGNDLRGNSTVKEAYGSVYDDRETGTVGQRRAVHLRFQQVRRLAENNAPKGVNTLRRFFPEDACVDFSWRAFACSQL
jgi:hypothetical protein